MFSLVEVGKGYSLVMMQRLFTAVAPLLEEYGPQGVWASVVAAHRLSCPVVCGIFLDQGLNCAP